jgi:glutathione synthase/RimK-type ligase-like ATP-grasp enzyme
MATSWGKFQMMGFNYKIVGFETVGDMVDYLKKGEAEQLEVFCDSYSLRDCTNIYKLKTMLLLHVPTTTSLQDQQIRH